MSVKPNKTYPAGRKCAELGCDKILSTLTKGPKCFFHTNEKSVQEALNKTGVSHNGSLCTSGSCGNAALATFISYEGE